MKPVDLLDPTHPLTVLDKITDMMTEEGKKVEFQFMQYTFVDGDGDYEDSYEWHDEACFSGEDVKARCNDLADFFHQAQQKERDIVVTSEVLVLKGGEVSERFHIPMLDFSCNPQYNEIGRDDSIHDPFKCTSHYFTSGRSMHAYGVALLTFEEWTKFMGRALLMNYGDIDTSDDRWIGHCLERGYAALRLTCNEPKYLQLPAAMRNPFTIDYTEPDIDRIEVGEAGVLEPLTDITGCDV